MYQFLKLRCISLRNISGMCPPVCVSERIRKCSLCNKVLTSYVLQESLPIFSSSVRCSSANISPDYICDDMKKKKIRKRKKYTELLEVSGNSTAEKKATLKKLGAKNLSLFTGSLKNHEMSDDVDCSLGKDPLSERISKEEKDMVLNEEAERKALLEELRDLGEEVGENQKILLDSLSLTDTEVEKSLLEEYSNDLVLTSKPEESKMRKPPLNISKSVREKVAKMKCSELEKAGKIKSLNNSLITYLELCSNCGIVNRGLITLQYYINRKNEAIVTDVMVFNKLLEGFARTGNIEKVTEVWKIMQECNISPSLLSFAFHLEAIARSKKHDKGCLINNVIKQLEKEGHAVSDLFHCQWKNDSREVVLSAVKAVRPSFNPYISPPDLGYTCSLLKNLNVVNSENLKSPADNLFIDEDIQEVFREQLKMEKNFFIEVKSIEKSTESTDGVLHYRQKLESLKASWEKSILAALNRHLSSMNALHRNFQRSFKQLNVYPYLVILDKHDYKDIIMYEIRKLAEGSETFSPTVNQLYRDIGNQVRLRYEMKLKSDSGILKKIEKIYEEYSSWYLNPRGGNCNNFRQKWQLLSYKYQNGPSLELDCHPWPQTVLHGIGKILYNIIMRDIKIDVNTFRPGQKEPHYLPAFYSVFRHQGHITKEEVKPHPVLSRLFRAAAVQNLSFNVTELPMLTPPIPWTSLNSGGYLIAKTNLIRLPHQAVQQWERLNQLPKSQIYPCFDSLNQLSSIPWKVNKPILDTIIEVFNNGGCSKLDIPEPPSACPVLDPITPDMTKTERFQAYRQRMILRRQKAEMYSLWCDALYRLSLANHFRDKIFWLPHNMDFRGRVYPCPPHLNHLGSDMARSLLAFAKGEPLGLTGLDWLKLHLVNLTGLKKRDSVAERMKFANEIIPEILDSANNPLDGKRWWTESEEPWQTLACCIEIRDALDCPNGPEAFVSHFPVHQDGSCNGLQHYAALGRDSAGAFSVNLAPSDMPQDVYSCVAALVERERSNDAAKGDKIAQVLEGFVRRKVIKQTVMTTVYGVTRFGARLQIAKQLKDIDDFPKESVWPASMYLVAKTFASLREMFTSTREIQDWFTESARMISQVCGQNVEYVTPLGLPVVQPYNRYQKIQENKKTNVTGNVQEHYSMDMYERPNVMKQKNAFPPNFIHSLDSTHMMLTSLHCENAGITFVSVHDCFWTHPCSVHIMNKICREQFVALHSQPILQDLSQFMLDKYGYNDDDFNGDPEAVVSTKRRLNSLLAQLPSRGDFELTNVLKSTYFFS